MTIFRSGRRRIALTNGAVLVALAVWTASAPALALLLPLGLAVLVLLFSACVLRRPRLSVSDHGLTVANMLTTTRLPWRSIRGFGYGAHGRAWCAEVEAVDGRVTPIRVLSDDLRAGGYPTERIGEVVAELRARLGEHTGVQDSAQVVDLGGGRTLDVGALGGSDVALRRSRRDFRWALWSLAAVGVFAVGLGVSTVRGAASRPQVYAHLRRAGLRLDARFEGCGPPDRFDPSARDVVCRLSVAYRGRTRHWISRDDYPQFAGLPIGAPVPVLLDPVHPATVYTVHDVDTNDNGGIVSALGLFGIGVAATGVAIFVCSVRIVRSARRLRPGV